MPDMVPLDIRDLRRGLQGALAHIIDASTVIVHVVHGRRRYQVAIERRAGEPLPYLSCSCGSRKECAHVDFTLQGMLATPQTRAWLEGFAAAPAAAASATAAAATSTPSATAVAPSRAAPTPRAPASPPRPAPTAADETRQEFDQWIRDLARERQADPTPSKPSVARVVLYFVTPNLEDDGLDVTVWLGQERKSGGMTRGKQLDLVKVLRGKTQMEPQDLGLIAALHGHSRSGWRQVVTLTDQVNALVLALIDTGRCYLDGRVPRLLERGEPRTADLGWVTLQDGTQEPCAVVGEATLPLMLAQPMYLDSATGTVGMLEFTQALPVVRRFIGGPEVPAETSARLAASAGSRLAKLGLPAPRVLTVETLPAPPPTPCLRLYTMQVSPGYFLDPITFDGASLRFAYGDRLFDEGSAPDSYREVDGDRVRVRLRRRDVEQAAAERLRHLGFVEILATSPQKHVHAVRSTLAHQHSVLDRTLNHDHATPNVEAWAGFLDEGRRELVRSGWKIEVDPSFRHATTRATNWRVGARALADNAWFELEVGIDIGGERGDLMPVLLHLVQECKNGELPPVLRQKGKSVVVPMADGRKVELSTQRLRHLVAALLEMQAGSKTEKGRLHLPRVLAGQVLALEEHVDVVEWHDADALRALADKLRSFSSVAPATPPATLAAELRSYQRDGLSWLQFLRAHDLGGILADDMGLGKTVQALAHVLSEKTAGRLDRPCLVVSPTSVVANWSGECARFAPDLRQLVLHGANRSQSFAKIAEVDIVLTTYPLVLRDLETLQAQPFHLLILDEAQAIKNAGAKVAKALRTLDARHRLCLTGTPLENNLAELWAQFDFLMPGLLGDVRSFGRVFRAPIEKAGDADRRAALVRRIRPFILRRTKDVVAAELPPKTTIVRTVELSGDQRDLYETIRLSVHERVRQAIQDKSLEQAQIVILDALLKLRQVCCDPRLVKLDAAKKVKASAKLETLMELLPALLEEGRRVLLFSQFTSMLALIEPELRKRKIEFVEITGDTKDRKTPVQRFQAGEVPVFLISLKAGGTGLNLTAADTVIHYDPWWNPAVEQQATDRAHRIGQDKPVFVYKLIAAGTVEERIGRLQERKQALAAGMLDGGDRQGAALTRDDVEALFAAMDDQA